jgi:hypothetical protein
VNLLGDNFKELSPTREVSSCAATQELPNNLWNLHGEKRNAYRILMGKPEEKRPRHRWEDSIKMDLREIE